MRAFTGDSVLAQRRLSRTPNLLRGCVPGQTAGLPVAYRFCDPSEAVVDRLSRVTGPYDIKQLAVTASRAALADQAFTDA